MRPYVDYKKKMLGKRIDFDGSFGYQCVDLFKDYCKNVLGMNPGKTGNADQIWTNDFGIFDKKRTRIEGTDDLMQGDVIVRGTKKGYHIGIFDRYVSAKIYILEQNGSGKNSGDGIGGNAIRIHGYNPSFFTGIRRSTKIRKNFKKEVLFITNKIRAKGSDATTIDYIKSIRYKK